MPDLGDTILGVWAHPDDETYLSSGLMARAAREGARMVCVTATRGEGGSLDEDRWPPTTLGAVREQELLRSLEIIGISEHVFLDLPDIGMDTSLPDEGAARVLQLMEEIQPDSVLTFGPDGMTGHCGHISVSDWTTDAFAAVAPPGASLFYACQSEAWAAEFVPMLEPFDVYRPGTPPVRPEEDLDIVYHLEPEFLDLKMRAIREHTSQVEGMVQTFGPEAFRSAMRSEFFRLATSPFI